MSGVTLRQKKRGKKVIKEGEELFTVKMLVKRSFQCPGRWIRVKNAEEVDVGASAFELCALLPFELEA